MCLAFPLGEGGAGLRLGRCTVTDEVRPLKAGVTAAVSTAAIERVLGSPYTGEPRRRCIAFVHGFSTKRIAIVEKMQSDESEYEESKK